MVGPGRQQEGNGWLRRQGRSERWWRHGDRCRQHRRGQANVVGVALLLAMTALSLGVLTASVGTVVEGGVAAADASRVADALEHVDDEPVTELSYTTGSVRLEPRTVRLLQGSTTRLSIRGDAVRYQSDGRQVLRSTGAVIVGRGTTARLRGHSPVVVGERWLQVSITVLNVTDRIALGGAGSKAIAFETNTTHEYRRLPAGSYALAIETSVPTAWERTFERLDVETARRDYDGDGVDSVVARFDGELAVDLAIHDVQTVVRRG